VIKNYHNILSKLTDFDLVNFNIDSIIHEANKKYQGTICILNGTPTKINTFHHAAITIGNKQIAYGEIKSIVPFKPKPGIYRTSEGKYFLLYKTARRQWLKSLRLDSNYGIHYFNDNIEDVFKAAHDDVEHYTISDCKNFALINGYVYYKSIIIGLFSALNEQILLLDTTFMKEVSKIWNYYSIICLNQKLGMEESVKNLVSSGWRLN
jgi:hypothetical protein